MGLIINNFFFKLGFTVCIAEQQLEGMELQEKKHNKIKIKAYRKSAYEKPTVKRCLLILSVDLDIVLTSRNGERKIMQSIRITSRPPLKKRKCNKLSQFR